MSEAAPSPDPIGWLPLVTTSPSETRDVGVRLSRHLHGGSIVALYGDLGVGKTELVKGVCLGLGINEEKVHSPTFTIVNEYQGPRGMVFHFDAYRLNRIEEFFDLGYEDYFFSDAVSLIEWADRIEPLLPADVVRIRMSHAGEGRRLIEAAGDKRHTMRPRPF